MASYSGIMADASQYVREGIVDKWQNWIILIICCLIQFGVGFALTKVIGAAGFIGIFFVPLFTGYIVRVLSGVKVAPEINDWARLFVDGWKLNIIAVLYMIPALIVGIVIGGISIIPLLLEHISSGKITKVSEILLGSGGLMITGLIIVIISLISFMAFVHFARTGKMTDAFNVSEVIAKIGNGAGWGTYILVWILVWIMTAVLFFIILAFNIIPMLGFLVGIILTPLWGVFIAKINSNFYDNRP